MIEDKLLIWKFKCGSRDALRRIYEKYENYLLTLGTAILANVSDAEDVVHDVFVAFAQSAEKLKLRGSLKSYLATCLTNRIRDRFRARLRRPIVSLDEAESLCSGTEGPEVSFVRNEEMQQLMYALACLPYEQRETIMLHLYGGEKFRQIAVVQGVTVNTVQARYRYGLDKLRSLLNHETEQ
ncbi:MAG: RNA polymerase sigma factor [Planctomycetota bacterium]|jgi:RNA polymerase sigma-70 factor (ECF subfamily)